MGEKIEHLTERLERARARLGRAETRHDAWQSACRSDGGLEPLRQEIRDAYAEVTQIESALEAARNGKPGGGAALNAGYSLAISPFVTRRAG